MKPPKKSNPSFWSKVKNFFSIDDSVFQEEPLHPNAERYSEKKISMNFIFGFILGFLILVNILIGFNLNAFYFRAILGFLFIILVPGALIMLMMKIREVGFWEYLVYTIGLSVAFIMFAGLAVNWILPWLMITSKPLQLKFILPIFDMILLVFWMIAYKINQDLSEIKLKIPQLDWINNIFFTIPILFPFMAVTGAFLLNNHGTNIVTMVMLGGIALYVLLVVIFRKRLNPNIYPWAIWMISISLLLASSMRSWYVGGPDISLEYWVFQLTKEKVFWSISNFNNAYNVMLSLNIFPTTLSYFINVNNQFIFKLFIPIVFSIISLIIYLISRKKLSFLLSFFAGLLFLSSPDFINWYSIPIRQEIAFLFFSLMILVLFSKEINPEIRNMFFVIFGFSMIVSHYSTAYIALAIFLLAYIFTLIYKWYENRKIKKVKLKPSEKQEFHLTSTIILLLFVFGFLWYSQVSDVASGPISFIKNSFSNIGNIFNEDVRQGGATDPFFGFFNNLQGSNLIEEYKNESLEYDLSNKSEGFSKESYINYQIRHMPGNGLDPKIKYINLPVVNYYSKQIISKLFQLFILFGLFYVIKNKDIENGLKSIFLGATLIVALFLILPFFSIDYGITRFIQQTLIILSPLSIIGGEVFFERLRIKSPIVLSILLIIFLLLFCGFIFQITGGNEAKTQLNNFGEDYDANYMFNQDFSGAGWLNDNKGNFKVYADLTANLKLNSYAGKLNSANTNKYLVPNTISKQSYVYLSAINNIRNMGFFSIKGLRISFNFPTEFLNDNKNKIYSNGGSEIFK